MSNNSQLSLLAFGGLETSVTNVFSLKERKNDKGEVIGQSIGLGKRKDVAEALNLKGKANSEALDAAILKGRDAMKPKIAELVTKFANDPEWTSQNVRTSITKSGELRATISFAKVSRKSKITDEAIARELGMTIEQVAEARERQLKAMADASIEVATVPQA